MNAGVNAAGAAALDDVFSDDIVAPAVDGYPLAVTLFLPRGIRRNAVLNWAALDVTAAVTWMRERYRNLPFAGGIPMRYLVLALLLASTPTMACSFDTDCQPGSRCLKTSGNIYGVCVGGLSPGNANDQQPASSSPLDVNGTYGNTCTFDTDCGPGSHCIKDISIQGVCMR